MHTTAVEWVGGGRVGATAYRKCGRKSRKSFRNCHPIGIDLKSGRICGKLKKKLLLACRVVSSTFPFRFSWTSRLPADMYRRAHAVIYSRVYYIRNYWSGRRKMLDSRAAHKPRQPFILAACHRRDLVLIGYIDAVSIPPQAHSPSALLLLDLNNGQVEMKIERSCAG